MSRGREEEEEDTQNRDNVTCPDIVAIVVGLFNQSGHPLTVIVRSFIG